jgi:alpha-tubulin suppressor-like RCC1 family protein
MKKKHTAHSGFLTLCISLGLLAFFAGLLVALSAIANPQSSTRENVRYADGHAHRAKGPPVVPTTGIFEAWVSPYNGQAQAIAVDASGNVYVTGTRSFGLGHEYATIRYDSAGQEQWVALYHGPANDDFARAIAIDSFGNVYVTGYSRRFAGGDFDYATIKYDAGGQEQWVARSNGSGYDYAYAMAIDAAGNVYVTGESNGSYATIKYNSAGQEQWIAHYNGAGAALAIVVDASSNVFVTGGGYGDYATVKYNSAGQQQWVATYNGPGNGDDYAFAVALDELGNVYVTGQSVGTGTSWDYATIKYNASGQQQWVARYNGPANDIDVAQALALDDSGNVYVTGFSTGVGSAYDYATIKYNSAGQQQWVARYNGPGNTYDAAYAIAVDGSENVYVTGYGGATYDYTTIKYSSDGQQRWIALHSSGTAYGIALDSSSNVYVTGASVTIKYIQGPTATPTATATATPTATVTSTASPTPTATGTQTPAPRITPTPRPHPSPAPHP